jgi:nucleoside-diphosphate-sugar epimerase
MKRLFVAGGTGYIGSATVAAARAAGWAPVVLTRSPAKVDSLRAAGLDAIVGDLETPGPWRDQLAADAAVFVAAPPSWGKRVSKSVARTFSDGLVRLTSSFFAAAEAAKIERIVYIAGTSFYGDGGDGQPQTESFAAPQKGWGPYLAPAVDVVLARIAAGADVVLAFPGQVYGPASWNEQLYMRPIAAGKAVTTLRGHDPLFSPIHVDDCARAIVHLVEHGTAGERYFLVDDQPLRSSAFVDCVARALDRPLRKRAVPTWLCSLILGPVLTDYATAHTNFSNARLKSTGFELRYPTAQAGVPDVARRWRAAVS